MAAGGKLLVLHGGISHATNPTHDAVGREVAVLNIDSMTWDKPGNHAANQRHAQFTSEPSATDATMYAGVAVSSPKHSAWGSRGSTCAASLSQAATQRAA